MRSGRMTLTLAFLGAFFAVGIPYWLIPYSKLSLPSGIWNPFLIAVAALAIWPRVAAGTRFWRTTLIVGSSVPAAVMARVIFEGVLDPTSHNLWPFEIVLAAGPGFLPAFVGALIGGFLDGSRSTREEG